MWIPAAIQSLAIQLIPLWLMMGLLGCVHATTVQEDHTAAGGGHIYYFSDCQAGAAKECVPGSNGNSGLSPASPKRTIEGFDVNRLPAGSRVLFAKGGVWTGFNVQLQNMNATLAAPLVFDSYAPPWKGTAAPWLHAGGAFYAFQFGAYQDMRMDGGYVIRNLKLDGNGAKGAWGFHLRFQTRGVVIENNEVTGFELGFHFGNEGPEGHVGMVVRGNHIHHNSQMGMLGDASELLIEGNTFTGNNFYGGRPGQFGHAIYLGGKGGRAIVRGNRFIDNSTVDGVCSGGNFTVHGQWDGLLIEDNLVQQKASRGSCFGFSINPGYPSAEWFRNVVIRRNTIVNVGYCSICLTSAPGVMVEGNLIVNTQAADHVGVMIPDRRAGDDDAPDGQATVRNNVIYLPRAGSGSVGISVRHGDQNRISSNIVHFGDLSQPGSACFMHGAASAFAEFVGNTCHHALGGGRWSAQHLTLAQANAAGLDKGGQTQAPPFAVLPTAENLWRCEFRSGRSVYFATPSVCAVSAK